MEQISEKKECNFHWEQCDQIWLKFTSLWLIFGRSFPIWQNVEPTLANMLHYWASFHCFKWPNIEK